MEIAAEYQGKPSLDHYADILFDAGREYGNCLLVVENNGIGISVLEKLINKEYPNLYYSVKGSPGVEQHKQNTCLIQYPDSRLIKTRPLIVAKWKST